MKNSCSLYCCSDWIIPAVKWICELPVASIGCEVVKKIRYGKEPKAQALVHRGACISNKNQITLVLASLQWLPVQLRSCFKTFNGKAPHYPLDPVMPYVPTRFVVPKISQSSFGILARSSNLTMEPATSLDKEGRNHLPLETKLKMFLFGKTYSLFQTLMCYSQ